MRFLGSFVAAALLAGTAFGQGQGLVLKLGQDRGGLVVGADYVINDTPNEGVLVYGSMQSEDSTKGAPGITAIGGGAKVMQSFGPYQVYLSPGLGVMNYSLGDESDLLIGPRLAYGLHAELDPSLHVGFENQKLYSWMGDQKGLLADTFLISLKLGL